MKRFLSAKKLFHMPHTFCASISHTSISISSSIDAHHGDNRNITCQKRCSVLENVGNSLAWHQTRYPSPLTLQPKQGKIYMKIVVRKSKKGTNTKSYKNNKDRSKIIADVATTENVQCNMLQKIRHASYSSNFTQCQKGSNISKQTLEVGNGTPLIFIVVANMPKSPNTNKTRSQVNAIETTVHSHNMDDVLGDVNKRLEQLNASLTKALESKVNELKGQSQQEKSFDVKSVNNINSIADLIEFLKKADESGCIGCQEIPLK